MSARQADAVVVGGGHNGLVAAARLAREGLRVVLLEASDRVGGGAAGHEFHPGFRAPTLAQVLPAFDRRAVRALDLKRDLTQAMSGATSMALLGDGAALGLGPDPGQTAEGLRAHSATDAAAYPAFHRRLDRHAETLRHLFETAPARLDTGNRRNLLTLGRLGWLVRRRGRAATRDLLRIITMNVADLMEECFETPALQGALALDAVLGTNHGPRSPNTVFTLLHRLAGHRAGGPAARSMPVGGRAAALTEAAESAGVEIRTGAPVERIHVANGAARGVEIAGGGAVDTGLVISNTDPVTTFRDLVGSDHLDADFLMEVKALRTKGATGRVFFALECLPNLPMPPGGGPLRWLLAPSMDYVENAFDHVKYGETVPEPALEVTLPSLADAGCAPEGRHVMSVNVAYAPHAPAGDPERLAATVAAQIERYAPGFIDSIIAQEGWGPREIEQRFRLHGGHWHHVDIALDQFFMMRPVPGWAQYRTPVDGLYLCGAGTHPGGGVTGTNGYNAATAVLQDRRRARRKR